MARSNQRKKKKPSGRKKRNQSGSTYTQLGRLFAFLIVMLPLFIGVYTFKKWIFNRFINTVAVAPADYAGLLIHSSINDYHTIRENQIIKRAYWII